jgi:hypothetical protein
LGGDPVPAGECDDYVAEGVGGVVGGDGPAIGGFDLAVDAT